VIVLLIIVAILFHFFTVKPTIKKREERMRQNTVVYELRSLYKAIRDYSKMNNGYLPAADSWCDLLIEHDKTLSKDVFNHPRIEGSVIAFNENLDRMRLLDVDKNTVLLFEAKGGLNLAGGKELMKNSNPSRVFVDILFMNGKIEQCLIGHDDYNRYTIESIRWKP
jgi:hypothetical protein